MKFFSKLIPDRILLKDMAKNKSHIEDLLTQYDRITAQMEIFKYGIDAQRPQQSQTSGSQTGTMRAWEENFKTGMEEANERRAGLAAQIKGLHEQMEKDFKNLSSTGKKQNQTLLDGTKSSITKRISEDNFKSVKPVKVAKDHPAKFESLNATKRFFRR